MYVCVCMCNTEGKKESIWRGHHLATSSETHPAWLLKDKQDVHAWKGHDDAEAKYTKALISGNCNLRSVIWLGSLKICERCSDVKDLLMRFLLKKHWKLSRRLYVVSLVLLGCEILQLQLCKTKFTMQCVAWALDLIIWGMVRKHNIRYTGKC